MVPEGTLTAWLSLAVRRRDLKHADRIRVALLGRLFDPVRSGCTVAYSSPAGIVYRTEAGRFAVHLADRLAPIETRSLESAMAMLTRHAVARAMREGIDEAI